MTYPFEFGQSAEASIHAPYSPTNTAFALEVQQQQADSKTARGEASSSSDKCVAPQKSKLDSAWLGAMAAASPFGLLYYSAKSGEAHSSAECGDKAPRGGGKPTVGKIHGSAWASTEPASGYGAGEEVARGGATAISGSGGGEIFPQSGSGRSIEEPGVRQPGSGRLIEEPGTHIVNEDHDPLIGTAGVEPESMGQHIWRLISSIF
ncbi:MAG TPA: hypothetical protein V6C81_27705 [Planktothrix sp.]|jgi:hypothetical protein